MREEGKTSSATKEGEIQNRTLVAAHGTYRSPVGEFGEERCGNGEIPNFPPDLMGSDGQYLEAFQHSLLSYHTAGTESHVLGLATVEGGLKSLREAKICSLVYPNYGTSGRGLAQGVERRRELAQAWATQDLFWRCVKRRSKSFLWWVMVTKEDNLGGASMVRGAGVSRSSKLRWGELPMHCRCLRRRRWDQRHRCSRQTKVSNQDQTKALCDTSNSSGEIRLEASSILGYNKIQTISPNFYTNRPNQQHMQKSSTGGSSRPS